MHTYVCICITHMSKDFLKQLCNGRPQRLPFFTDGCTSKRKGYGDDQEYARVMHGTQPVSVNPHKFQVLVLAAHTQRSGIAKT